MNILRRITHQYRAFPGLLGKGIASLLSRYAPGTTAGLRAGRSFQNVR